MSIDLSLLRSPRPGPGAASRFPRGALRVLPFLALLALLALPRPAAAGRLDGFARCLAGRSTFYGAYWCPQCARQKELFEGSAQDLNYVECYRKGEGRKGRKAVCEREGIDAYPTWEFFGRKRVSGRLSLERLAEETGCSLPW
jgi:hypothetical protein